jgi:hypothetical protein
LFLLDLYAKISIENWFLTNKSSTMTAPPDDIAWVPQSRILLLCDISRATLNSWIKSGLDIPADTAAYHVDDLVKLLLFAAARKHLSPGSMVAAWRHLVGKGEAEKITEVARELESGDRFDLVIDPEFVAFRVVYTDRELASAVRLTVPRPVVVVALGERMWEAVDAFKRASKEEEPPAARRRGRPTSESRRLRVIGGEGGA